jgi:hypothetical protein
MRRGTSVDLGDGYNLQLLLRREEVKDTNGRLVATKGYRVLVQHGAQGYVPHAFGF